MSFTEELELAIKLAKEVVGELDDYHSGETYFISKNKIWDIQYRPRFQDWVTWYGNQSSMGGTLRGSSADFIKWAESILEGRRVIKHHQKETY